MNNWTPLGSPGEENKTPMWVPGIAFIGTVIALIGILGDVKYRQLFQGIFFISMGGSSLIDYGWYNRKKNKSIFEKMMLIVVTLLVSWGVILIISYP